MKRRVPQLPLFNVVVSFNRHYDVEWLVRANDKRTARKLALAATARHRPTLRDLRWYGEQYGPRSRYTMRYATTNVERLAPPLIQFYDPDELKFRGRIKCVGGGT